MATKTSLEAQTDFCGTFFAAKLLGLSVGTVQALDKQKVKVQGFMLPLEPGDKQRHFLLSAVPTSCNFCTPAGPEGLIEVRSKNPVRYTLEPVTVEGQMSVLKSDPYGLFYRVTEALQTE